jgi:hypothetical protein
VSSLIWWLVTVFTAAAFGGGFTWLWTAATRPPAPRAAVTVRAETLPSAAPRPGQLPAAPVIRGEVCR